jgi:rubredoxin
MARPEDMWQCQTVNCGYIYDPDRGDRKGKIPKGTKFEDLPEDWKCPICGAARKCFALSQDLVRLLKREGRSRI